MSQGLFVCGIDPEAGSSVVVLGLGGALRRMVGRFAFFKPVGNGAGDQDVAVMRAAHQLEHAPEDVCPITIEDARDLVAHGRRERLLEHISRCHEHLNKSSDFLLAEGINNQRAVNLFDMDINVDIAERLGMSVLLVARCRSENGFPRIDEIESELLTARQAFQEHNVHVVGAVVNRVPAGAGGEVAARLGRALAKADLPLFGALPWLNYLGYPKLEQIADELGAELLSDWTAVHAVATKVVVAAMEPRNFLKHMRKDGTLVIAPGDRESILLTLACAQRSQRHRSVSGIVLTGGLRPDPEIIDLIEDMDLPNLPIMAVEEDTFTTATRIRQVNTRIRPQDRDKINTALSAVAEHFDHDRLWQALAMSPPPQVRSGSDSFLQQLIDRARQGKRCIVLPEGDEPRTLRAVARIAELGLCRLVLLGDPDRIHQGAKEVETQFDDSITVIDPLQAPHLDRYVELVVEARKHKRGGMTPEVARQWLAESPIHVGTLMVKAGDADGLVSGAVHSTGDTIRPAFQIIGVHPDPGIASSVFFMALKDRVLVYGDCAIIPNPNAAELAAIAVSSARTARAFGVEPRVAMLSYSTGKSGAGESVDKVAEATQLVHERNPDFAIDGPLQYDAAIDPTVGKLKQPDSPVAGRANVFIFPDLDAGNIAYKAVQRSADALAVGPVLQGLNQPVNDLSRGCTVDDIVYTVAVTAIQAATTGAVPAG
jgi:phosphate acetyltransferase